jgi:hypothetical protein
MSFPLSEARKFIAAVHPLAPLVLHLHGERVLLSEQLAALYVLPVKVLHQAVKRNTARFPPDFVSG